MNKIRFSVRNIPKADISEKNKFSNYLQFNASFREEYFCIGRIMRPWQHSISSTNQKRGLEDVAWSDALAVHEFLDMSKAGSADRRHRIVMHHSDLGTEIAKTAFPNIACVAEMVSQHIKEDLGREAKLADWLECTDKKRLPKPNMRRIDNGPLGVARLVETRVGSLVSEQVLAVTNFLFLPQKYYPENPSLALIVLMNSIGPLIVRGVFGPPSINSVNGQRVVIDWGWIAECVIMVCYGRIANLSELVDCVCAEPLRASQSHKGIIE